MKKKKPSAGFLLWAVVFAALLLLTDQILLRVPLTPPGVQEVQVFYREFRRRLLALPQTAGKLAPSPAAPAPSVVVPAPRPVRPAPAAPSTPAVKAPGRQAAPVNRYVYADEDGNLQFAESLDEVPAKLRREAKRLDD